MACSATKELNSSERRERRPADGPRYVGTACASLFDTTNAPRRTRRWALALLVFLIATGGRIAFSKEFSKLDKMDLDRWAKLREVERYQLQMAERFYKSGDWKAASSEFEKFVTLYEQSEGASFAQLKWGICQTRLRQANTAIKDGFQTVIDYWPDSPDAVIAQYLIGRTYKEMGQIEKATQAYSLVIQHHASEAIGVLTLADLLDIAKSQNDVTASAGYLKTLTFDVNRTADTVRLCEQSAQQYARLCFERAAMAEGAEALATNGAGAQLLQQVASEAGVVINRMAADETAPSKTLKMAEDAAEWCQTQMPEALTNDDQKQLAEQVLLAMADLFAAAGQEDRVISLYRQIVARCGESDTLRRHQGAWYVRIGQFEHAARIYHEFDDTAEGLGCLALSYREREVPDAAVRVYLELASLDPDRRSHWMAQIGTTRREAGQFTEAVKVYRELIATDPVETPQWLWKIGSTYYDARKWKDAIGVLRQCSNFPQHLMLMATCHRRLKQFREALQLYQQIGAEPAYAAWAAYQIASTWEESGDKESAIKAFRNVCKRFPRSSQASSAHSRLQRVYNISVTLGGALDK